MGETLQRPGKACRKEGETASKPVSMETSKQPGEGKGSPKGAASLRGGPQHCHGRARQPDEPAWQGKGLPGPIQSQAAMRPDNIDHSNLSGQMGQSPVKNPADLFHLEHIVKICAPMVRYSKLPFRTLVRKYNCDLCYTPMIVAADFVRSVKARHSEFTTNQGDRPLIVQFAAKEAQVLADAAGLVSPFADGIDLNCGCPQRIHEDLKRSVDLCQKAESAGVSWITVHGRNVEERHQPVCYDAIKTIKDSVSIPVVANGVMVARGLLANPALFAGYEDTPLQCVQDWVDIALEQGTPFTCFHHHLMYMLERVTSKQEKKIFNVLSSTSAVLDYLRDNYGVQ
ncbi:hypothetical protein Chor_002489 [Crotalus horridus]